MVTLSTLGKPTVLIRSKEKKINVEEGSAIEISCSAHGFPKPHVYWRKTTNFKIQKMRHPNLVLSQIKPENAGEYACVASNSEGKSEDILQINVLCKENVLPFYKV